MSRQYVILLHGLARTARSMNRLGKRLQQEGYQVVNQGYPSRRAGIKTLARFTIPRALRCCDGADTIHFVTHSMGGILLRYYLEKNTIANLGRVVMISPPNQGSEIVDRLGSYWWFRLFHGPAGAELGTGPGSITDRLGRATFQVGIITGNRSGDPVLSSLLPSPNDGKVSVKSAKLAGMQDILEIPCGHTFIMNNQQVQQQVVFFLGHGRFDHRLNDVISCER